VHHIEDRRVVDVAMLIWSATTETHLQFRSGVGSWRLDDVSSVDTGRGAIVGGRVRSIAIVARVSPSAIVRLVVRVVVLNVFGLNLDR
jgi:hypothetical protein